MAALSCCCWHLALAFWGTRRRATALAVVTKETRELRRADRVGRHARTGARRSRRSCCPARCRRSPTRRSTRAPTATSSKWYVDIGAHVKAGQLLAEIDTPEIDQQLEQARADLATAEANARLAQTTAERYRDLIKTDSVSQQDLDNANGSLEARQAAVDVGARQREAARAAARVRQDRRAVRRRHHRAQHRRRRADRFGQQRAGSCSTSPRSTGCACSSTCPRSIRARRARA